MKFDRPRTERWIREASPLELDAIAEEIVVIELGVRKYRNRNISLPFMILKIMILSELENRQKALKRLEEKENETRT